MFEKLKSPIEIGGLTLKNRIVFAPTSMGLKEEEYLARLEKIAEGGCALIIIGDVPVTKGAFNSLYSKSGFAHYEKICRVIHKHGCLVSAQLHQSDTSFKGLVKYMPAILSKKMTRDDLQPLINENTAKLITNMPKEKIVEITTTFGTAAKLAMQAGFDMIQVHGDRMCGSFSSSIFNRRHDEYGDSPQNRARFAVACISEVRKALPYVPIDYKLPVRQEMPHYGNAGVLVSELETFVPLLEKAGVNSFHVTLADHAKLSDAIPCADHEYFSKEGCFLKYCDQVRKYTKLPICGVGGLTSPEFIEQQIETGRIDFAAMSRQLLADPQWSNKVINGNENHIKSCIRCNVRCLGGMQSHKNFGCIYDKEEN